MTGCHCGLMPSTNRMRFRAAYLTRFFGADTPVENLAEVMLAKYVAARRKAGRKLPTVNRALSLPRAAWRLAKKRRLIKEIPQIDRCDEHNVRMVFFEPKVYEAITSHVSAVLQDMMRFAYLTGWRKGQIARLTWKAVHHDGVIRLPGTTVKHKDVQVLSLTGELAEVIEHRRQARHPDSPWVFHRDGRPVRDFRGAWTKALQEAGVEDYVFHDFRRTATRTMALAGVLEKHIMQVTGHKTRHMIDRYNIPVERDTQNTLAQTQTYLVQQRHRRLGRQSDTSPPEEQ